MGFNRETKMFGRFRDPVLNRRLFYQLAEGVVHFYGVQLCGIEVEESFLRELFWVESRFPGWIRPSRGANVESRHIRRIITGNAWAQLTRVLTSTPWPLPFLSSPLSLFLRATVLRIARPGRARDRLRSPRRQPVLTIAAISV